MIAGVTGASPTRLSDGVLLLLALEGDHFPVLVHSRLRCHGVAVLPLLRHLQELLLLRGSGLFLW
jgi:hypothetical protein